DRVLTLAAPFKDRPRELVRTENRFAGLAWGPRGDFALVSDFERNSRRRRTLLLEAAGGGAKPRPLWDRSAQDHYGDPGQPLTRLLPTGQRVLWQHGDDIFLAGPGASPGGDRPFLDRFNLKTLKGTRLFRCGEGCYESVVGLLAEDGSRFLTQH